MTNNFIKNFPFSEVRPKQEEVLNKMFDNWDKFKYFVIEAPTGSGKSAIANAIGMSIPNSFLLTITKQLQDQYVKDFKKSRKVVELKGKANYRCNLQPELNVECGPCTVNQGLLKDCKKNGVCSYYTQRDKVLKAKIAVLSIPFFLYSTTCGRYWTPRDMIVVDECHLLEQQLVQWATTLISPTELKETYDIFIPEYVPQSGYEENREWLDRIWNIILSRRKELEEEVKDLLDGKDPDDFSEDELEEIMSSHGMYYQIDKLYKKMETFFKSPNKESWLCEPKEDGLLVTPVAVNDLFKRYVDTMAEEKIIFMSATVLDMVGFCKNLGIKREEVGLIRIDSEFPPELSPIIYKPCGSMSYNNLDGTMPKIIETVKELLAKHPDEKAIIHTGNYRIAREICEKVDDSRLIMKNEGENNESLIKRHINSKEPTVLVSPSLTTGTDLKDDLSRWQIIVKLPFLSLADPRVNKRKEIEPDWYVAEMFRTFVQAAGRSTRSEEDWSTTYVLDTSFYHFLIKHRKWFSPTFLKRIIWKEN